MDIDHKQSVLPPATGIPVLSHCRHKMNNGCTYIKITIKCTVPGRQKCSTHINRYTLPGLPRCDDPIMRPSNHDKVLKLEEVSLEVSAQ